jgi:hypothetical protein
MRRVCTLGALVTLLAAAPARVSAQTSERPWYVDATLGPSFRTSGTAGTASTAIGLNIFKNLSIAGEVGTIRGVAYGQSDPMLTVRNGGTMPNETSYAYHVNANLRLDVPEAGRWKPTLTAGLGTFRAPWAQTSAEASVVRSRDRFTHPAINYGATVSYRLTDWLGIGADFRQFVVFTEPTPTAVSSTRRSSEQIGRIAVGASLYFR